MTQINLKFTPENEDLVYNGFKCATTRDEKKGNVGDTFPVRDRLYRLVDVMPMEYPSNYIFYRQDGFNSAIRYTKELEKIYPETKKGSILWIHFFAYAGDKS